MSGNHKINEIKFDPDSYLIDVSLLHIKEKILLFIKSMFVRDNVERKKQMNCAVIKLFPEEIDHIWNNRKLYNERF